MIKRASVLLFFRFQRRALRSTGGDSPQLQPEREKEPSKDSVEHRLIGGVPVVEADMVVDRSKQEQARDCGRRDDHQQFIEEPEPVVTKQNLIRMSAI